MSLCCLEKGVLTGAAGIAVPNLVFGGQPFSDINVPIFGEIGSNTFMFGIGFLSSVATDVVHMSTSEIPVVNKILDNQTAIINAGLSAGLLTGTIYMLNPQLADVYGYGKLMMVGAAQEVAGAFAYNMLKSLSM